jgi:hypothetical protein
MKTPALSDEMLSVVWSPEKYDRNRPVSTHS